MKNVENLETSPSITLELEVVNIQRCSIIVPHKEGDDGGGGGEPAWQIWFIPVNLPEKPAMRLQGILLVLHGIKNTEK